MRCHAIAMRPNALSFSPHLPLHLLFKLTSQRARGAPYRPAYSLEKEKMKNTTLTKTIIVNVTKQVVSMQVTSQG